MNKSTGELDQTLVIKPIAVPAFQPELLENIVGFVIVPSIEAFEVSRIAGVVAGASWGFEGFDKCGNPVALGH